MCLNVGFIPMLSVISCHTSYHFMCRKIGSILILSVISCHTSYHFTCRKIRSIPMLSVISRHISYHFMCRKIRSIPVLSVISCHTSYHVSKDQVCCNAVISCHISYHFMCRKIRSITVLSLSDIISNSISCHWQCMGSFVYDIKHLVSEGGDSSVVRAPDSWTKGRGFESPQERRETFLLHGQLSVLTLISISVPPPCYCSRTYKILVILPKVQVAGYGWCTLDVSA